MKRQPPAFACFLLLVPIATFALVGCGAPNEPTTSSAEEAHDGHDHADGEHQGAPADDHSGWWCPEHGVPEGECTRCDSSLIAEFKEKEDWCDEHDRPNTQCFICSPELENKFAARYEAKYGEKPPVPTQR